MVYLNGENGWLKIHLLELCPDQSRHELLSSQKQFIMENILIISRENDFLALHAHPTRLSLPLHIQLLGEFPGVVLDIADVIKLQ